MTFRKATGRDRELHLSRLSNLMVQKTSHLSSMSSIGMGGISCCCHLRLSYSLHCSRSLADSFVPQTAVPFVILFAQASALSHVPAVPPVTSRGMSCDGIVATIYDHLSSYIHRSLASNKEKAWRLETSNGLSRNGYGSI